MITASGSHACKRLGYNLRTRRTDGPSGEVPMTMMIEPTETAELAATAARMAVFR